MKILALLSALFLVACGQRDGSTGPAASQTNAINEPAGVNAGDMNGSIQPGRGGGKESAGGAGPGYDGTGQGKGEYGTVPPVTQPPTKPSPPTANP